MRHSLAAGRDGLLGCPDNIPRRSGIHLPHLVVRHGEYVNVSVVGMAMEYRVHLGSVDPRVARVDHTVVALVGSINRSTYELGQPQAN